MELIIFTIMILIPIHSKRKVKTKNHISNTIIHVSIEKRKDISRVNFPGRMIKEIIPSIKRDFVVLNQQISEETKVISCPLIQISKSPDDELMSQPVEGLGFSPQCE